VDNHRQPVERRDALQRALGTDFELGDLIGWGGFAEVYRARDVRLRRDVAVKFLRPELAALATTAERFQREAQAAAKLRHPNIAPIYSVGEGEGQAYLIMPLISGTTLEDRLEREGRLPLPETQRILSEVAGALVAAHAAGVVHRDIKPENIMLEGEDRRALVMDFGIARAADLGGANLTESGVLLGTPAYTSPEQAAGDSRIDHRADIYSLGVVAFRMLTGRLPFEAPTTRGLLLKHITEDAPPVGRFRPECPSDLANVVGRCLAKEPEERWPSATALRAALETASGRPLGLAAKPARAAAVPAVPAAEGPSLLASYRRKLLAYLAVNAVAFLLDLATNGAIDFAPLVLAVTTLMMALGYSKIWLAGYSLHDVLSFTWPRHGRAGKRADTPPRIEGAESPYADGARGAAALSQARRDRATIAGQLARIPRAQRQAVAAVQPAVDGLISRMSARVRRLDRLDRTIARMRATLDAPGRSEALDARDRQALQEAESDVRRFEEDLETCALAIHELTLTLQRVAPAGAGEARAAIESALARLTALIRGGVEEGGVAS
jgi:tRNA A-37 threonylcarbamoyl transferase component Bud32